MVKSPRSFNFHLIPCVFDVGSSSKPALSNFLVSFSGKSTGLHSIVKKWIWLKHIDYIKFDFGLGGYVTDSKVEPLRVSFGIYVILENQIVLVFGHFISCVQVPRLKIRIEKALIFFGTKNWRFLEKESIWLGERTLVDENWCKIFFISQPACSNPPFLLVNLLTILVLFGECWLFLLLITIIFLIW